jgi:hypothetical protein
MWHDADRGPRTHDLYGAELREAACRLADAAAPYPVVTLGPPLAAPAHLPQHERLDLPTGQAGQILDGPGCEVAARTLGSRHG